MRGKEHFSFPGGVEGKARGSNRFPRSIPHPDATHQTHAWKHPTPMTEIRDQI
jgi:hypothetical protein